jgi:predicted membrane protein
MDNSNNNRSNYSNRILGGLILAIGIVFFLRNLGFYVPDWLFSWHVFLIVFGVYLGYKRDFRGGGWLAMVLVGVYFTLQRTIVDLDVAKFFFPVVLTGLGLYLILAPRGSVLRNGRRSKKRRNSILSPDDQIIDANDQITDVRDDSKSGTNDASQDFVDTVNVFSATQQKIFSKSFRGGDVVCVFGGCDLNFSQADFEGQVTIEIVAIFGGVKIIIPPGWQVRSELTAIFGGLEDKTAHAPFQGVNNKLIVLKGAAIFGGVEIKNY